MLAALAVLYGCGQASAPSEKRAGFHSPDVNQGETIELSVTDPTVGYEYAFDCDIDDANGYDAPFLNLGGWEKFQRREEQKSTIAT